MRYRGRATLNDYRLSAGGRLKEDVRRVGEYGSLGGSMVEENGLLVYRNGSPLPARLVDEAIYRSRQSRSLDLIS